MPGMTPTESAAEEAFEEAGIRGWIDRRCAGVYGYGKLRSDGGAYCTVKVYPMRVTAEYADWPERPERRRKWMTIDAASARVREKGLKKILSSFNAARGNRLDPGLSDGDCQMRRSTDPGRFGRAPAIGGRSRFSVKRGIMLGSASGVKRR